MANDTAIQDQASAAQSSASAGDKTGWWCNFCDFRTDDPQAYLSHSCQDVLAKRGVEVKPTGRNECS